MLKNYNEVARHFGLNPYVMLGRAGLHPSALQDLENWLPAGRIMTLLDNSASHSGHDDFSVILGESRTFGSLGPVSLLLKHEATLRDIIQAVIEYRQLINELVHIRIKDDGHSAIIEWALVPGLRSTEAINLLATIAYRVLVDGAGCNWQPDCLHFRHSTPRNVGNVQTRLPLFIGIQQRLRRHLMHVREPQRAKRIRRPGAHRSRAPIVDPDAGGPTRR